MLVVLVSRKPPDLTEPDRLKNKLILTSALSLLILFQSGCLLNYSNDVVLRQDEPLRGLSFESEYAMHVFDQSVRRAQKTD
jgi:hypothetical protein